MTSVNAEVTYVGRGAVYCTPPVPSENMVH